MNPLSSRQDSADIDHVMEGIVGGHDENIDGLELSRLGMIEHRLFVKSSTNLDRPLANPFAQTPQSGGQRNSGIVTSSGEVILIVGTNEAGRSPSCTHETLGPNTEIVGHVTDVLSRRPCQAVASFVASGGVEKFPELSRHALHGCHNGFSRSEPVKATLPAGRTVHRGTGGVHASVYR